jgi:predicted Ser/Thr protein kinase
MLTQRDKKCVHIEDSQTTTTEKVNVDELAKKWVDVLFSSTTVLRLGNGKKARHNKIVQKRKAPSPRK